MKRPSGVRQFRALYSFVLVLVVFLALAALIPLIQFRGEVDAIAADDAARDIEMLGSHVYEAILRHDYTAIRESVALWGQENDRVLLIRATAPNGFVFAEYNREPGDPHPHPISVSKEIRQDERLLATLHLVEDYAFFRHEAESLIRRSGLALVVFTLGLGVTLWFTLRRAAILPMQQLIAKVQDLNLTLEERVQNRTADLARANEELEREIAERLSAEDHLRESEERYRSIVSNAADGVLLLDISRAGPPIVAEANESACRMHGYSHEELVGMPVSSLDVSEDREKIAKRLGALRKERRLTFEVRHVRKDGSTFPLEVSAQLVSVGGKPFVISVERDITERKKGEELLQQAKESLERQNEELRKVDRMKDGFIRDVSHELKTPVAKHKMQLELLQGLMKKDVVAPQERRAFAVMEQSVERQQNVIRNLLNMSRLEAGGREYSREPVHLADLLRKVLADYAENIESRGISVTTDLADIVIESDLEMLWHVFSNLISNAIKFQRSDEGAPHIAVSTSREHEEAVIRIVDAGIGMSREDQERLFTRFFQTTPSTEGSGVGLMICKHIVEDLGGTMLVESAGPGMGTTAEVRLPAS